MKIKFIGVLVAALVLTGVGFAAPLSAQAQTTDIDLLATLLNLNAEQKATLATLLGGAGLPAGDSMMSSTIPPFTRDLSEGSTGTDVMNLQKFLNMKGYAVATTGPGSTGQESTYFGALTTAALARYQAAVGISPAVGYFGPTTRAHVNSMLTVLPPIPGPTPVYPAGCTSTSGYSTVTGQPCSGGTNLPQGCTSTVGYSPVTGAKCDGGTTPNPVNPPVTGGAGSIDDADFASSLSSVEVGEGDDDVPIVGLDIDADVGSDIEITAVRLDFDQSTAGSDWDNYAKDVSIWLEGEEYARVDADEFNDDNAFDKTISLSPGAIVKAGDKNARLEVRVSAVNNLDSSDATDTWTVIFASIRFRDGQGATVTDSTTGDIGTETRTFSFETYATAADTELKILADDSSINDPRLINVDATSKTKNVELMSFTLEAEGSSDLEIKRFGVNVDTTAAHVDGIIAGSSTPSIWLEIDGDSYGTASYFDDPDGLEVGQDEDVLFDDVDYTIPAGTKVKVVIMADLLELTGQGVDAGNTITLTLGETETDQIGSSSLFEIEDEAGEDLVDADITGSLTAGAHEVQDSGIFVEFVTSASTNDNASNDLASANDTGTFSITFDVTAIDAGIFIDGDVVASSSPSTASIDGTAWATTTDSTNHATTTVRATLESDDTDTEDVTTSGQLSYKVDQNTTRRFTLTIEAQNTVTDPGSKTMAVKLTGIGWGTAAADVYTNLYNLDLGQYKTPIKTLKNI